MRPTLTRRSLLRRAGSLLLTAGLGASGLMAYGQKLEPIWLDLTPIEVILPRLPAAFDGYRLIQLSDLHYGDWLGPGHLDTIVELVNRQQADLIVITGDFVTSRLERVASELVARLHRLRAHDGVVAVQGNHDYWSGQSMMSSVMRAANVTELANAHRTLERGSAVLQIAGVDDVWTGQARLERLLGDLPTSGAAILLAHEPDFADVSAATGRFDLQLSGHSHGGQVALPGIGPLVLPHLARKYPVGRYQVGGMIQYTNRGVGLVGATSRFLGSYQPYLRLNCRPEITLITLRSPHQP